MNAALILIITVFTASLHDISGFTSYQHLSLSVPSFRNVIFPTSQSDSTSSLGLASFMDVERVSQYSSNPPDNMQMTESQLSSDIELVKPALQMENAQLKHPWWVTVLDNPSLKMGRLITLGAAAIYGTNFATVKFIDATVPLSISAAVRFGLASAIVSAIVLGKEKKDVNAQEEKKRNSAFWSGAEIGVWYSIGYISQAEGLQTVAAGKSAFFNALAVVVVPILDATVKGKILQQKEITAVGLACLGVGLLEVGPTGLAITSGDILAFMQMIFFGVGYWRLEAVSHSHPHQTARITVGQLAAVATAATIYALTEFGLGHLDLSVDMFVEWMGDPFILSALVWTGLISTALALYLETVALKVVSATELTLLMTTTSLWGASFAYFTIGETLSQTGLMGGMMILAGCVLGNMATPAPKEELDTPAVAIEKATGDHPLISP